MNIKNSIIAASAALLISATSAYGGYVAGQKTGQEEAKEQVAITQHYLMKLQESYKAEQMRMARELQHATQKINHVQMVSQQVTERFKITKIEDGRVHGELLEGSGEGINYPLDTFESYGVEKFAVNDLVDITWPKVAYDNSEWDAIADIELVK